MSWRRTEPAIDRETVDQAIVFLMEMDAKLDRILGILKEDDDGEEGSDHA